MINKYSYSKSDNYNGIHFHSWIGIKSDSKDYDK